jgi:general secretion pathway protein D
VVEKNGALHVTPLPEGDHIAAPVVGSEEASDAIGLITRIFKLKHINSVDLKKVLEPMVRGGKTGAVSAFGPTNHLIVSDTAEHISRLQKIIDELDQPGSSGVYEIIHLEHASAQSLAKQITDAVRGMESAGSQFSSHLAQVASGSSALPAKLLIVAAEDANALIIVGNPAQVSSVKTIIEKLDVEIAAGRGRLNAIFLKYLSAEEAAKSLNGLLAKTAKPDQVARIAIEPSITNNALLVDASPVDFEYLKKLVSELDTIPQQVLVEILIVEIAENHNLDLGVEWATIEQPQEGSTTVIGRSRPGPEDDLMNLVSEGLFPQGILFSLARGVTTDAAGNTVPNIPFLIRALQQDRDVNILSKVPLWAQNNTEAKVSVVNNIPILRSTIEGGAGTARDVIQNIDRIDVGIELSVTPLVNTDGDITLKLNPSIEAIIDPGPPDSPFTPTIAKREVTTTVTIPDNTTVVISGLIREDKISEVRRVPLLGSIPLLGKLFQSSGVRKERTNLLIFVTPHIVTDAKDAARLKDEWRKNSGVDALEDGKGGILKQSEK